MSYSIVILSKNATNARACISALRANGERGRIILVDDGMDLDAITGSPCFLCDNEPVLVVKGESPFVYARNANIGIRAAGTDDVVLLNDDALLTTPGGLGKINWDARHNPRYGIIGAVAHNVGNLNQRPQNVGLREDPRMVCFVCVYIPRYTIDLVGMLDERFVHYGFEDDDYCLRVRKAGLLVGISDDCVVDHGKLESSFRGRARVDLNANKAIFCEKWGKHPL